MGEIKENIHHIGSPDIDIIQIKNYQKLIKEKDIQ